MSPWASTKFLVWPFPAPARSHAQTPGTVLSSGVTVGGPQRLCKFREPELTCRTRDAAVQLKSVQFTGLQRPQEVADVAVAQFFADKHSHVRNGAGRLLGRRQGAEFCLHLLLQGQVLIFPGIFLWLSLRPRFSQPDSVGGRRVLALLVFDDVHEQGRRLAGGRPERAVETVDSSNVCGRNARRVFSVRSIDLAEDLGATMGFRRPLDPAQPPGTAGASRLYSRARRLFRYQRAE